MPTFDGTLPPDLERATITSGGVLADKHQWLQPNVDEFRKARQSEVVAPDEILSKSAEPCETTTTAVDNTRKKRILMLGSGMVAAPAVDFIAQRSDVELIIGISKNYSVLVQPLINCVFLLSFKSK